MCFTIAFKSPTVQTAEKDIVCYKRYNTMEYITRSSRFKKNVLISPYQRARTESGASLVVKSLPKEIKHWKAISGSAGLNIHEGFHSYSSLFQAKQRSHYTEVIVQCVIPKGSLYFYHPGRKEYVSTHFKVGTLFTGVGGRKNIDLPKDKSILIKTKKK